MRVRGANLLIIGLLVCSVLVLSLPTVSSPSENRLADLVASSDLVAVADILEIEEDPARRIDPLAAGLPRVARLSLVHVWKGEPAVGIGVPFMQCTSWPAGPAYVAGDRVVVFLKMTDEGWATLDLAPIPGDAAADPLETLDLDLLGHGPGARCLPGLPVQRPGTAIP